MSNFKILLVPMCLIYIQGSRGRHRMVVGFTTTYVIIAYHH